MSIAAVIVYDDLGGMRGIGILVSGEVAVMTARTL
jgi:hypothetical protein